MGRGKLTYCFFARTASDTVRSLESVLDPPTPKSFRFMVKPPLKIKSSPNGVDRKGKEISFVAPLMVNLPVIV